MEGTNDLTMVRSSKRVEVEEDQNDRISQLPESVLVEILSYLPTDDAVKMASFPRFRQLWTFIRCLSFDQCAYHNHDTHCIYNLYGSEYDERFLNLIRHVLILHERTTIDEFHLRFAFNLFNVSHEDPDDAAKEKRMATELTTWIKFAVRKQVKVLDLDLLACGLPEPEEAYELPNSVLASNCLEELRLAGCGIKKPGPIQLKSLTKLSLKGIILSDKIMCEIVEGCPMLEELSLNRCSGISELKLTNPNIKRLNIVIGWRDEVAISCPSVKSLEIAGCIQRARLKVSSSFSDAALCFGRQFMCEDRTDESIQMLLSKVAEANVFRLCTWTTLIFTIWNLTHVPTPITGWKSVELRLLLTKWHLPGICSILKTSHGLETLTFYIYPGSDSVLMEKEAKLMESKWMEDYDFDVKNYWKSQQDCFVCLTKHLKSVMIYADVTEPYVFDLIEFLLKNALVLEKMVISTNMNLQPIHGYEIFENPKDHLTSKELFEFSTKLSSLPRASKSAVIQLSHRSLVHRI